MGVQEQKGYSHPKINPISLQKYISYKPNQENLNQKYVFLFNMSKIDILNFVISNYLAWENL